MKIADRIRTFLDECEKAEAENEYYDTGDALELLDQAEEEIRLLEKGVSRLVLLPMVQVGSGSMTGPRASMPEWTEPRP